MLRACGLRSEGLYLSIELSPFGLPLEAFFVDPAVKWEGPRLRAPMFIEDAGGTTHMILGIGQEHYPYFSDFAEEVRRMGLSKKLPRNFDPSRLTPGKSKFLLVHSRAIPQFKYEAEFKCPKDKKDPHECLGALYPLSAVDVGEKHHVTQLSESEERKLLVKTPSVTYTVAAPKRPVLTGKEKYQPGIIMAFTSWGFQWVDPKKRETPKEVKERIEKAKFRLETVLE